MNKFQIVKDYLNTDFERYIQEWFPNAIKISNSCYKTGDFSDKPSKDRAGGSLTFDMEGKYAKDFATGETAGDIISIYAHRFTNGNQKEALDQLIKEYNLDFLFGDKDTYRSRSTGKEGSDTPSFQVNKEKDIKVQEIIDNIEPYQVGDPVDLYLKNRGITKYSKDCYIYKKDRGVYSLVNICYKTEKLKQPDEFTKSMYKKTAKIAGLQQIYLTTDGHKKESNGNIPNKIQRAFSNGGISGNPVRLTAKGKNNGYIYITEGVENGLSLQEYINNEVWCSISISNMPTLPFDDNKVYIFVFDNDYGKKHHQKYSEELVEKLESLQIEYYIKKEPEKQIIYDLGEYNNKMLRHKLGQMTNKHFLYLLPNEKGCDTNDLLKNKISKDKNQLQELLEQPPISMGCQLVIRQNIKTKIQTLWRPEPSFTIAKDDLKTQSMLGLKYDTDGLATRFFIRYGDKYKYVDGIGVCTYEEGKYIPKKEGELFEDVTTTIALTYYEFDYILNPVLLEEYRRLWQYKGAGELRTVDAVNKFVLKKFESQAYEADEFDSPHENTINMANGYYDLNEGRLYPHCKDKLFFKKLNIEYSDNLNLSNINNDWNKFLYTTFCENIGGDYRNDLEGMKKIKFLQKAMGYTFSSGMQEEKLFIIKGVTRSGKNTFLDTIQEVMSDYCGDMQDEEFLTAKEQNSNYLLGIRASLKGKRFLHISEISKSRKLNGAQIKRLVGNQRITAKYLHQNNFSYQQQCKYWIATNNIDFNEFDESIKTKLYIVDFNRRFYEAGTEEAISTGRVMDKTLKTRLLQPMNRQFILKWIIEGYKLYKQEGLDPTKEMVEILQSVEEENDSLGAFFKERMVEFDDARYKVIGERADIHKIYKEYKEFEMEQYDTSEEYVLTFKKFMKQIRARGFEIRKRILTYGGKQLNYITDYKLKYEKTTQKTVEE